MCFMIVSYRIFHEPLDLLHTCTPDLHHLIAAKQTDNFSQYL
jgi:hypothetical protein